MKPSRRSINWNGSRVSIISQNDALELSDLNSILNKGGDSLKNAGMTKPGMTKLLHSFENILNSYKKTNEVLTIKKDDLSNHLASLNILNGKNKVIREAEIRIGTEPLKVRDENELRDIEKRGQYKVGYFSHFNDHIHEFLFERTKQIKYCLKKLRVLYETEKGESKALEQYQHSVFDQIVS